MGVTLETLVAQARIHHRFMISIPVNGDKLTNFILVYVCYYAKYLRADMLSYLAFTQHRYSKFTYLF